MQIFFNILIPELCVCTYIYDPLPYYSDVYIYIYLIACNENNIIHKETFKQET